MLRRFMIVLCSFFLVITIGVLYWNLFFFYETIHLNENVLLEYTGYDTKGSLLATMNQDVLQTKVERAYERYDKMPFHFGTEYDKSDFEAFMNSIMVMKDKSENLKNGDKVFLSFTYDEELAKSLKIKLIAKEEAVVVSDLPTARVVSKEELFDQISVTFSGTSPELKLEIVNHSEDDFLKTVLFSVEENKLFYAVGDAVNIRATWNEAAAAEANICIDADAANCLNSYTADGADQYLLQASQIPEEFIDEANAHAKTLFDDAGEYGMRIFSEAHVEAKWEDGKAAVFTWSNPVLISSYFKAIRPESVGKEGMDCNELDFIYIVHISQPSGGACEAEAVVRYKNLLMHADGTLEADLEDAHIVSASYNNNSIIKNVVTACEDDYSVEKLAISEYY